jgi:hypothetical protein
MGTGRQSSHFSNSNEVPFRARFHDFATEDSGTGIDEWISKNYLCDSYSVLEWALSSIKYFIQRGGDRSFKPKFNGLEVCLQFLFSL